MPMTTFLHDGELDQPTGDAQLDELLAEARALTGRNYQIVRRKAVEHYGFLGLRRRTAERMQLYVEVCGVGPWQVLVSAHDAPTISAYLYGLINGIRKAPVDKTDDPIVGHKRPAP